MTKSHVLLLKTPSTPTPITSNSQISITHLPLLSTNFNQHTIIRLSQLFQDDTQQWDGVVLCSQRAVQAYEMILTSQAAGRRRIRRGVHFVVGKQTRTSLLSIKGLELDEEDQVVGSESGNGQALANEIITFYSSSTSTGSIKLLFLCGDKTNESLPSILSSHTLPQSEGGGGGPKISLDSHIVYSTCQSTKFEPDFLSYLHDKLLSPSLSSDRIWLALCSPSGAQSLCRLLRKRQLLLPSTSTGESELGSLRDRLKFVAIGTTTKRYLEDREGVKVDAVAEVPGEEGLVKAVEEWEDACRRERDS